MNNLVGLIKLNNKLIALPPTDGDGVTDDEDKCPNKLQLIV